MFPRMRQKRRSLRVTAILFRKRRALFVATLCSIIAAAFLLYAAPPLYETRITYVLNPSHEQSATDHARALAHHVQDNVTPYISSFIPYHRMTQLIPLSGASETVTFAPSSRRNMLRVFVQSSSPEDSRTMANTLHSHFVQTHITAALMQTPTPSPLSFFALNTALLSHDLGNAPSPTPHRISNTPIATKQALLVAEYQTLASRYGAKHPKMKALTLQIDLLAAAADKTTAHALSSTVSAMTQSETRNVPTPPQTTAIIILFALIGFSFTAAVAIIRERNPKHYISANHIEHDLSLPCDAILSEQLYGARDIIANHAAPQHKQWVDALQSLRMNLSERHHKGGRVIMITSSGADEGKTSLSATLAYLYALSGQKVALVDTDLRRPRLHSIFNPTPDFTPYTDALQNDGDPLKAAIPFADKPLDLFLTNAIPQSAPDIILNPRYGAFIESLKGKYDVIMIDSPACIAVNDAFLLSTYADHILYAIAWQTTPCRHVQKDILRLKTKTDAALSTVLTRVVSKKYVDYGYGKTIAPYE